MLAGGTPGHEAKARHAYLKVAEEHGGTEWLFQSFVPVCLRKAAIIEMCRQSAKEGRGRRGGEWRGMEGERVVQPVEPVKAQSPSALAKP